MPQQPKKQNEVLQLIAKYGVMSSRTVWEALDKRIGYAAVRKLLNKLEDRGLIVRPTELFGGQPVHYWMLSREKKALAEIVRLTGLSEDQIVQSKMRYTHFAHEDLCTLFQLSMLGGDSRIKVLRNKHGLAPELPSHLMSKNIIDQGYCPDLCLGIPQYSDTDWSKPSRYAWLAVEIDRSYRTAARLAKRMNVYTKHTLFSGVLYFMPSTGTAKDLQDLYARRGGKDALRLLGTKTSFLASAQLVKSRFSHWKLNVFVGGHEISLKNWLLLFSAVQPDKRDKYLEEMLNKGVPDPSLHMERQVS